MPPENSACELGVACFCPSTKMRFLIPHHCVQLRGLRLPPPPQRGGGLRPKALCCLGLPWWPEQVTRWYKPSAGLEGGSCEPGARPQCVVVVLAECRARRGADSFLPVGWGSDIEVTGQISVAIHLEKGVK